VVVQWISFAKVHFVALQLPHTVNPLLHLSFLFEGWLASPDFRIPQLNRMGAIIIIPPRLLFPHL
jgi:hypothetical protein